jgi:hypothetical protein
MRKELAFRLLALPFPKGAQAGKDDTPQPRDKVENIT